MAVVRLTEKVVNKGSVMVLNFMVVDRFSNWTPAGMGLRLRVHSSVSLVLR